MKADEILVDIEIEDGVTAECKDNTLKVKGPKGEVERHFESPRVDVFVKDGKVIVKSLNPTKKEKAVAHTYRAHIRNMIQGVIEPFKYELQVCSTHFPMNVSFNKGKLIVKNFYGEKAQRELEIREGVNLKVNDKTIELESPDKELAGMTANEIEQLTRITNKDLRIFQDGIYITSKAGKKIK